MLKAGGVLLLFISFLGLYTGLALSEPRSDFYAFEGYVRRRFDTMAAMPLREVESASSFWQYVHKSFLPGIYGNDTAPYFYPDHVVPKFLLIEGGNRLFGIGRLRMLKVQPNQDCSTSGILERFFPTCYGPYDEEIEDMSGFGPPNMITGENVFLHYPGEEGHTDGSIASYPRGGFMKPITANYNKTLNSVQEMEDNGFVGPATRAIFLDWTVYNFNLGYYAVCRLLFEVSASGQWVNSFNVDILMTRHLDAIAAIFLNGDWLPLVGHILLMLFVIGYVLEEMSEFVGFNGWRPYIKGDYFKDAWNVLDWLNLVLIIVTFRQMTLTWGSAGDLAVYTGDPNKATLATFTDLSQTVESVRLVTRLTAFNAVLTWFKAVKYISILPYITTFMETVTMTQRSMGSVITLLCSVLFGFVLAYNVAFGEQIPELRTPWGSFVFLMRSFVGNAEFATLLDRAPFLGAVLTFMFMLAMVFVILNVFYAMMISALADAKASEEKTASQWLQTLERLTGVWQTVSKSMRLEYRFQTCVPGLYSRIIIYQKQQKEKEKEREEHILRRERMRKPDVASGLGPGDPSLGRRKRKAANSVSQEDVSDSDDGSEVDLGILRSKDQLTGKMFSDPPTATGAPAGMGSEESGAPPPPAPPMLLDVASTIGGTMDGETDEITEQGIRIMIDATKHVVNGIVDRTHGARGVLFGEMMESKEVLLKVGSVLEVLGRRARDLEAQQMQLLKMY